MYCIQLHIYPNKLGVNKGKYSKTKSNRNKNKLRPTKSQ